MALADEYDGYIIIGSSNNAVLGTCALGTTYGQIKSAALRRTAEIDEATLTKCNSAQLGVLLKKLKWELRLTVIFASNITPPSIGDRIDFPLVSLEGRIVTDIEINWEEGGVRQMTFVAMRWDGIGDASAYSVTGTGASPTVTELDAAS